MIPVCELAPPPRRPAGGSGLLWVFAAAGGFLFLVVVGVAALIQLQAWHARQAGAGPGGEGYSLVGSWKADVSIPGQPTTLIAVFSADGQFSVCNVAVVNGAVVKSPIESGRYTLDHGRLAADTPSGRLSGPVEWAGPRQFILTVEQCPAGALLNQRLVWTPVS
jgi:hypothetical protein